MESLACNRKNNSFKAKNQSHQALWKTMKLPDLVDRLHKLSSYSRLIAGEHFMGTLSSQPGWLNYRSTLCNGHRKQKRKNVVAIVSKRLNNNEKHCMVILKTARMLKKSGQQKRTKFCKTLKKPRTKSKAKTLC